MDGLIFALELVANVAIHLVVALAHLLHSLSALLTLHAILDIDLVTHVLDLASALLLLCQQSIDQVCHLYLHPVRLIVLDLVQHISEVIIVFQVVHLDAAYILLFFPLLHGHQLDVLLKAHQFALHAFENFIEELGGSIAFTVDHLVAIFTHLQSLLHHGDSLLKLVVQSLKLVSLVFVFLPDPHQLIE